METNSRQPVTFGYLALSAASAKMCGEQKAAIEEYAQRHALPDCLHVFVDAGTASAPLSSRPGGKKLLNDLRRGDHLVVRSASHLAPSLTKALREIVGLKNMGVSVHVANWRDIVFNPQHALFDQVARDIVTAEQSFQSSDLAFVPFIRRTKTGYAPSPDTILALWAIAEINHGSTLQSVKRRLDNAWWAASYHRLHYQLSALWVTGVFRTEDEARAHAGNGGLVGIGVPSIRSPLCRCQTTPCPQCNGLRVRIKPISGTLTAQNIDRMIAATREDTWLGIASQMRQQTVKPGFPIIIEDYLGKGAL